MRAIVFERHGGPEVLEVRHLPEPTPGPEEVLIEVRASGVNPNGYWARVGVNGRSRDVERSLVVVRDVRDGVALAEAHLGVRVTVRSRHEERGGADLLVYLDALQCRSEVVLRVSDLDAEGP